MKALSFSVQTLKSRLLIYEAKRWISFTERGGDNKGQIVEAFQKAVDGKAQGEAWCMAFVQSCLKNVDAAMEDILAKPTATHAIEPSEHCLTCWYKSPVQIQSDTPSPGKVAIWRHGSSTSGHTGIVVGVENDSDYFWTVEGNTGPSDSSVQREGDGVYLKRRSIKGAGQMKILGFLQPWI